MKKQIVFLVSLTSAVFVIAMLAQTRDEFKTKYGAPDDQGRYIVQPGIGLSVKYTSGHRLFEILIEPIDANKEKTSNPESDSSPKVIPSDVAENILNEVLPPEKRGKKGSAANAEFGCMSVDYEEYELVVISTSKRCDQQGGGTLLIRIRWKQ
jgi:hypothetical protein